MTQALVLIPTMPSEANTIEVPKSMRPEERAQLIAELGVISTELARVQTRDDERAKFADQRWRAIDARLGKLEKHVDASGQHDLALVTKALDEKRSELNKVKWWGLSILTTFTTSAIVGLVVYYLSTR